LISPEVCRVPGCGCICGRGVLSRMALSTAGGWQEVASGRRLQGALLSAAEEARGAEAAAAATAAAARDRHAAMHSVGSVVLLMIAAWRYRHAARRFYGEKREQNPTRDSLFACISCSFPSLKRVFCDPCTLIEMVEMGKKLQAGREEPIPADMPPSQTLIISGFTVFVLCCCVYVALFQVTSSWWASFASAIVFTCAAAFYCDLRARVGAFASAMAGIPQSRFTSWKSVASFVCCPWCWVEAVFLTFEGQVGEVVEIEEKMIKAAPPAAA